MEEAGLQPSVQMYRSLSSFAQTRGGAEYAAVIQERLGMLDNSSSQAFLCSLVLLSTLINDVLI